MRDYFLILFLILGARVYAGEEIRFEQARDMAWKNNRQLAVFKTDEKRKSISRENIALKYKPELKTYLGGEILGSSDEYKASGIANLKGSYLLYDGKQREAAEKVADYEIEITKLEQDRLKAELDATLKDVYIEYDFLAKTLAELERKGAAVRKFIQLAQTRENLGTSTGTERINFKVEYSLIEAEIELKKSELITQIENFNFTLGSEQDYLPVQDPRDFFGEIDDVSEKYSSQSMKVAEINSNLTNARVDELEKSLAPKINLEAYVGLLPYSERDLEKPVSAGVALVGSYDLMDRLTINARKREILSEKKQKHSNKRSYYVRAKPKAKAPRKFI